MSSINKYIHSEKISDFVFVSYETPSKEVIQFAADHHDNVVALLTFNDLDEFGRWLARTSPALTAVLTNALISETERLKYS